MLADKLNQTCLCILLQQGDIGASFVEETAGMLSSNIEQSHPHLFAQTPVYITDADLALMLDAIKAIENVAMLPNWQRECQNQLPNRAAKVHGVFMGYDFHMTSDGPKLIEINTNAGGAFLNLFAAKQFTACCDMMDMSKIIQPVDAEQQIANMFIAEWAASGRTGTPNLIAIVDEAPQSQFLYPEFLLAQKLLSNHGMKTVIATPEQLELKDGSLHFDGEVVDLIYNRLTNFDLSIYQHIRDAWLQNKLVLTPDPLTYSRLADKRNLIKLSDENFLRSISARDADIALFNKIVPKTILVSPENADLIWVNRKHYFFKPVSGFGSKAVYKGEKLTKKTKEWILTQDYVAQELVAPSQRIVNAQGKVGLQKFDVRLYTYRGNLLAAAARIYDGQTTNFRTPGGGFAPLTTF